MSSTWGEIDRGVAARHRIARRESTWFVIAWMGVEGSEIPIRIEQTNESDRAWVLVVADVGPVGAVPTSSLLVRNLRLPVGSFALEGQRIVVRAMDLLESASVANVIAIIDLLAREAGTLRDSAAAAGALFADLFAE